LGPKASLDVAAESTIPPLLENDHSGSVSSQPLKYRVKLLKYATVEPGVVNACPTGFIIEELEVTSPEISNY
jgi:hypothetical protein